MRLYYFVLKVVFKIPINGELNVINSFKALY